MDAPVDTRAAHPRSAATPVRGPYAAATVVGLLFAAVCLLGAVTLAAPPRLSLVIDAPSPAFAPVGWVLPGSHLWDRGVRAGDRVLALDGRAPTGHDAGIWSGRRIVVRTRRGGTLALDARRLLSGAATWPLLALSPWFLLLGTLLYLRVRPAPLAGSAYALFASAAFALALAPATDADVTIATVGEHIAVPLFAAYFALFFRTFPAPRGSALTRAVLLAPALVVAALALVELAVPALYTLDFGLRSAELLAYLVLGAALLTHSYATVREPAARRGLTLILASTVASILPFTLLYLAPTLLGRAPILPSEAAILGIGLLPAGFAYAILRHEALPIRLLQRWLVRGAIWAAVACLFAGIGDALLRSPLVSLIGGHGQVAATLVLVGAVAVWFPLLCATAQRLADRALFRDHYDYRAALHALSRDLSLLPDLNAVDKELLAGLCRLMNLGFAALVLPGATRIHCAGTIVGVMPEELAAVAAAVAGSPRVVPLRPDSPDILVAPLHSAEGPVGHICLGPKATGEPFRLEDLDLLATLSGHLAAVVRNATLLDSLRANVAALAAHGSALATLNERLQQAQEQERLRLSTEIHDEPLQTAISLRLQLERRAGPEHDGSTVELSRQLVAQLRAACAAMRPVALDDLGLPAALDLLALEVSSRSGVPVGLDADPALAGAALSSEARLVLYRAAQEALTNSTRHGRPSAIHIGLGRHEGCAQLLVEDDGVGFAVADQLGDLALRGHLGLVGLRERARQAGGRVAVTARPAAAHACWSSCR